MTLSSQLQQARTEEDVKRLYVEALGLKGYSMNLIDIQTDEIWFEAKIGGKVSTYEMFTQLLHYVIHEGIRKGRPIPPFLGVIDSVKAAIMKTSEVLPLIENRSIKWGPSASQNSRETIDEVSTLIGTHFVSFTISTHEQDFIQMVKTAIRSGEIIRTQITPANLKQVFDHWVEMIGREIRGIDDQDYALLFYADIMHDGTVSTHQSLPAELLYRNGEPVFLLGGNIYTLGNKEGYRRFWQIYHKPPKAEYRNYLLERRDSLIPLDDRAFQGAYFTPLHIVDRAYDLLSQTLGEDWQSEYIVWDMCCGVGNLETKHSNPRNLYMSTLDQADVDVMKATKTCVSAERWQYDYLNDDITDDGQIDYSITDKVPERLRKAIRDKKKILILINPPYAEAGNASNASLGGKGEETHTKSQVAKNKIAEVGMKEYGKATNELFTQFLARISREIPTATIAMFSTMKYVNAPNFEKFRESWNAEYRGGFIVHSKAFDGLRGDFPIGFLIWQTDHESRKYPPITEITTEVLDKKGNPIGEKKFYNLPNSNFLNEWIERPKLTKENRVEMIPLKNTISPASHNAKPNWIKDAIGYCIADANDLQQAGMGTLLLSGANGVGHKGGLFITSENLWQVAILFSVRRLVKPTWQNDRDQFLQPTGELSEEFRMDCLIWMLWNGSNLTASADDLEWSGRKWSIVNHFIPFTESEVNAPERFESDWMVEYLRGRTLSDESRAVMDAGRELWRAYFAHTDMRAVRDDLYLDRSDVGWYQIRNALKRRNESGDFPPVSFEEFESAYARLTEKLRPMVWELGFLR